MTAQLYKSKISPPKLGCLKLKSLTERLVVWHLKTEQMKTTTKKRNLGLWGGEISNLCRNAEKPGQSE